MDPGKLEPPADLPTDVLEALHRGQRIEAIKRLRAKSGLDLAQAKRLIDEQRRVHPRHAHAQRQMQAMITEDRANTRLLFIAAILAFALLAWKFLIDV